MGQVRPRDGSQDVCPQSAATRSVSHADGEVPDRRDGFGWAGIVRVGRTAEWPTWTPPAEMVARDPNAAKWAGGQPGGPDNPLGARALYLYEGDQDTIYRIHGTPEPWTIGLDVSSGCIRMNNDDITDLHSRIQVGAKVIVLMQGAALYKGV